MKTIYKYEIEVSDNVQMSLPIGAEILSIQEQGDRIFLWALVEPSVPYSIRNFQVFGTGFDIPELACTDFRKHIATVQALYGKYVFHFFEVLKIRDHSFPALVDDALNAINAENNRDL